MGKWESPQTFEVELGRVINHEKMQRGEPPLSFEDWEDYPKQLLISEDGSLSVQDLREGNVFPIPRGSIMDDSLRKWLTSNEQVPNPESLLR